MRILVTGFAGYIGPVIVRHLRAAGHYVIGLDTGWFLTSYAEAPEWPDEVILRDIRKPLLPPGVDAVVHLAGLSNDPLGDLDTDLTDRINYRATTDLIFRLGTKRHVVISSCSVYGATDQPADEDTPPNPLTAYAKAKADVDHYVHHVAADAYNAVSLRLGTVFGYSPGHRLDLVVNKMVHDAIREGVVTVFGNAARPLVHVEDVASAVTFMVGRTETGIYNVVGDNVRIADLGREVAAYADADLERVALDEDRRDYMATAGRIAKLGWHPTRTVEGSLPVLFERTATLPPGDYVRLSALRRLIASGVLDDSLRNPKQVAA